VINSNPAAPRPAPAGAVPDDKKIRVDAGLELIELYSAASELDKALATAIKHTDSYVAQFASNESQGTPASSGSQRGCDGVLTFRGVQWTDGRARTC